MKLESQRDTDFFDIDIGVLQVDRKSPYLCIIYQDYVPSNDVWSNKKRLLAKKKKKKARNRYCPDETITDADYADDLELLVNTPTQAKSLLRIYIYLYIYTVLQLREKHVKSHLTRRRV